MSLVTSTCPHSAMKSHHPHSEGQFLIHKMPLKTVTQYSRVYLRTRDILRPHLDARVASTAAPTLRKRICYAQLPSRTPQCLHPLL